MSMKVDFSKGRQRAAEYINICRTIADSYPMGVPHGVQKDAVQNGFHTVGKKQTLKFTFELIENTKGKFFTMTDSNTKGLMGDVLSLEGYEQIDDSNHWARFESFGFTSMDPDAIGARGQGKFIFLAASKDHTMLYDSLRYDGTYRLGITKATKTDCPMLHWDGDEGRKKLRELTDLKPLTEIGTRVIVASPINELLEDLKNGAFLAAIEETWFRAIEKGRVEIRLRYNGTESVASVPAPFPVPRKDSSSCKTWIKPGGEIELSTGEKYRIKHLDIGFKTSGDIPEQLRGVAVIHYGMKITSIQMDEVPAKIRDSIFGYIEFDRDLDRELRKNYNQNPNHYDLSWRRAIPRAIKEFIVEELRQFGYKKLGIGLDPRERRRRVRTAAEDWAMRNLAKYAGELDLFGAKGIVKPPPLPPPPPPPAKKIGVSLRDFSFPVGDRAPRVNWGEEIKGFKVEIFNKTDIKYSVRLRAFVVNGDKEITTLCDCKDIDLPAKSHSDFYGPFKIKFSKSDFPDPGIYRLRVRLINEADHTRIDQLTRKIYVEKDPDFRYPFEIQESDGFSEPCETRQWLARGTLENDPLLYYNTRHPAYKLVEDVEEELGHYLFEVVLEGSMHFILNRPDREDGSPDFRPLDKDKIEGDPKDAYDEIINKISEIRGRYYEGA